jgi:hypothetical protein
LTAETPTATGGRASSDFTATRPDEDVWGVFMLDNIITGKSTVGFPHIGQASPNTFVAPDRDADLGSDAGTYLVGIFHSGLDSEIVIKDGNPDTGSVTGGPQDFNFDVYSQLDFELYARDFPLSPRPADMDPVSPADRDKTVANKVDGFIDPGSDTLLLGGKSVFFKFTSQGSQSVNGATDVMLSIDPLVGSWGAFFDTDFYDRTIADPLAEGFVTGNIGGRMTEDTADIYMDWDIVALDPSGLTTSSDLSYTYVVPEPLTMGAFGLAFAGLGGYIKKRNRKA